MPWPNVVFAQGIGQILLTIPCMYIMGKGEDYTFSWMIILVIVITGYIGAWSQISMTVGMQREKSASATAMRMSDVVFGYLWQVLFTHDAVSLLSIIGAFIITASILIIVIFKAKPESEIKETRVNIELRDIKIITVANQHTEEYSNDDSSLGSATISVMHREPQQTTNKSIENAMKKSNLVPIMIKSNHSNGSGAVRNSYEYSQLPAIDTVDDPEK